MFKDLFHALVQRQLPDHCKLDLVNSAVLAHEVRVWWWERIPKEQSAALFQQVSVSIEILPHMGDPVKAREIDERGRVPVVL